MRMLSYVQVLPVMGFQHHSYYYRKRNLCIVLRTEDWVITQDSEVILENFVVVCLFNFSKMFHHPGVFEARVHSQERAFCFKVETNIDAGYGNVLWVKSRAVF